MTDRALGGKARRQLPARTATSVCAVAQQAHTPHLTHTLSQPHDIATMAKRKRSQATAPEDEDPIEPLPQPLTYEEVIDLVGDDTDDEEEKSAGAQDESEDLRELSPSSLQTDGNLPFGCIRLALIRWNGMTIEPGINVELYDGDFLSISLVYRNLTTGRTELKGNLMRRANNSENMLTKQLNELYYIAQSSSDDPNVTLDRCLVVCPLEDVVCIREIIATNKDFPALSWRDNATEYEWSQSDNWKRTHLRLAVRRVLLRQTTGPKNTVFATTLRTLMQDECDNGASIDPILRLRIFLKRERVAQLIRAYGNMHKLEDNMNMNGRPNQEPADERGARNSKASNTKKRTKRTALVEHETVETITELDSEGEQIFHRRTSGSFTESISSVPNIKAAFCTRKEQRSQSVSQVDLQKTYGDICAGGGGMASGAVKIGLKPNFFVDNWPVACDTLDMSFDKFNPKVIRKDVHEFCINKRKYRWEIVDILHLSFPCTPHSYLNTRGGPKDEERLHLILSIIDLLQRCRPRVVTIEQVNAITTRREGKWFKVMISQLIAMNYSVRWKVYNLAEYGHVQARPRLMMTAVCPGEVLPGHVPATHGLGPGKKPFVTIKNELDALARYQGPVPEVMLRAVERPGGQPYDARTHKKGCITTSGGTHSLHPSGTRDFNCLEYAKFMGFPPEHKFAGSGVTDIRAQIGNAVPVMFAEKYLDNILRSLKESDRNIATWEPEVIELDDDANDDQEIIDLDDDYDA